MFHKIWIFVWAVISHWQAYLTGGVATALVSVVERLTNWKMSKGQYAVTFLGIFLFVSFFMTWQDEFERANALRNALNQKPATPSQVQVNVPPPTVVIQQTPPPEIDSNPTGFLQLEVFKFPEASSPLVTGTQIMVNFVYKNPGPYPVTDRHSFEAIFFAVRSDFPSDNGFETNEREIRALFEKGRKEFLKENSLKKTEPVGAGQTMFKTAYSDPVSENAVKGILAGTVRIYALAWATWKDSRKRTGTMTTTCYWLQPPQNTDLLTSQLVWHSCAAP